MTRGELITELAAMLGAPHEARFIVEEVLGAHPSSPSHPVGPAETREARAMAQRRRSGEPLQYILGHWAFRSLDLLVDPRVLIPRPETEQVVEVALHEIRALDPVRPTIVDAGTGSGAIALALATELASEYAGTEIWAVDASTDALAVAAANLVRVRRAHPAVLPVHLGEGRWLTALPPDLKGGVIAVVTNPPYVAAREWDDLPDDVRHEPRAALIAPDGAGGTPGLGDVEELLGQSLSWLTRPGVVVMELAPHQAEAATEVARALGYADVRVAPDLAQRPRALVARGR